MDQAHRDDPNGGLIFIIGLVVGEKIALLVATFASRKHPVASVPMVVAF